MFKNVAAVLNIKHCAGCFAPFHDKNRLTASAVTSEQRVSQPFYRVVLAIGPHRGHTPLAFLIFIFRPVQRSDILGGKTHESRGNLPRQRIIFAVA